MKKIFVGEKKISLFLCVLCALCVKIHSQQASTEIEILLQTQTVTYAQAARFILEASDTAAIQDPQQAFAYAKEKKWLPKKASADTEAKLDGVSLLLMQSFGFKGGVFYSMTKSARYAYRELLYKNIIQGRSDPAMKVSGEQLLFITNRMLAEKERHEELNKKKTAYSRTGVEE